MIRTLQRSGWLRAAVWLLLLHWTAATVGVGAYKLWCGCKGVYEWSLLSPHHHCAKEDEAGEQVCHRLPTRDSAGETCERSCCSAPQSSAKAAAQDQVAGAHMQCCQTDYFYKKLNTDYRGAEEGTDALSRLASGDMLPPGDLDLLWALRQLPRWPTIEPVAVPPAHPPPHTWGTMLPKYCPSGAVLRVWHCSWLC